MKTEIAEFCQKMFSHFCYRHSVIQNSNKAKSFHPMTLGTEENIPLQFFFQAK